MKLIKQSSMIWGRCPSDPTEAIRFLERAGRVCYASEDKITETSALPFVMGLIEKGHLSVLEHSEVAISHSKEQSKYITIQDNALAVGNLRAWLEAPRGEERFATWLSGKYGNLASEVYPANRRYTVEITTNRAMTHQLVRHRPASFSQQSQRYIRYGAKNPMQFIEPVGFESWGIDSKQQLGTLLLLTENTYNSMLHHCEPKLTPQQARNVLPNACTSTIVITADRAEWQLIFKLRCGGGADPQMIDLMTPLRDEMQALWEAE